MNNEQSLSHTKWECKYHLTNYFRTGKIFLIFRLKEDNLFEAMDFRIGRESRNEFI